VTHRLFICTLALTLLAGACGGDGDDAQAHSDAIADGMMNNVDPDSPLDREQAECFGDEVVARMGTDRLAAVGLSIEDLENGAAPGSVDLSDDDVAAMTDAVTRCIDFGRIFVDEMTADLALSDESAGCLVDAINEADFLRAFAESSFIDDAVAPELEAEMFRTLFDLLGECLTPEELSNIEGG
jgi:hypothetical protein